MLPDLNEIMAMQEAAVVRWHQQCLDNPYEGFLRIACHQCSLNYLLWHQEDAARSPFADDAEIALVKRTIDQLNQQRNDYVELMDRWIAQVLQRSAVCDDDAPLNTETPGSVIDRLAILALRVFHLQEQLQRHDVGANHRESVEEKLAICCEQRIDLALSLKRLFHDLVTGRKRHKVYCQFKMYNDPNLNPYLYGPAAGSLASVGRDDATGGPSEVICRRGD